MFKNINLYFVRHGETKWNQLQLFQGSSDSQLTLNGINQAKLTAKAVDKVNFVNAYVSPQKRAVDTAKLIINNRDISLKLHEGLKEIDFGQWEGKFVPDYYADPNFIYLQTDAQKYSIADNQGEDFRSVFMRSIQAIDDIITENHHGNILIVSHGSLLRQLIYVLAGGNWQEHLQNTEILANTSISIINYKQDDIDSCGYFTLTSINQIEHL